MLDLHHHRFVAAFASRSRQTRPRSLPPSICRRRRSGHALERVTACAFGRCSMHPRAYAAEQRSRHTLRDEEFVAVLPDTGERGAAKLAIASEKSPPRPYRARTRSTNFTK